MKRTLAAAEAERAGLFSIDMGPAIASDPPNLSGTAEN